MVVFAILVAILVRDDPKDMGLPGMDELEGRPATASDIKVSEALKSVMVNKKTWIISLVYTGLYTGYIVLLGTYGVSYIMALYGLSKIDAANLIISAVVGTMVSGLVIGYISDKIKKRKIVIVSLSIATLICWIIFIYVKLTIALLTVFLFIMGFALSCFTIYLVVENIVTGNLSTALNKGIETLSYAGAIAFGIMFVTASIQFQAKYKEFFRRKKKNTYKL